MDRGIVHANEICNPNDYENRKTYVGICFKNLEGNYSLFPVLCFYVGNSDGMIDHAITHELNHIYELNLKEIRNGRYECICGWDILNGEIETEYSQDVVYLEEDNKKRQYELFNEIINELKQVNPQILLVGLGSPKQEELISKLKNELSGCVMVGVGGSFDVMAGNVKRAPKIFQKLGLEWFYRLISQPTRWKRMLRLPKFVLAVLAKKGRRA